MLKKKDKNCINIFKNYYYNDEYNDNCDYFYSIDINFKIFYLIIIVTILCDIIQ